MTKKQARKHSDQQKNTKDTRRNTPSRSVSHRVAVVSRRNVVAQAVSNWVVGLLIISTLMALVHYSGAWAKLHEEWVSFVGRTGFEVRKVEIIGADRLDRLAIYDMVLKQHNRSMAAIDITEIRAELLQYGWIKDVRVSRRFPDRLVVDITERVPSAVWQNQRKLVLIDREGTVIDATDGVTMPTLPRLIGPRANIHTEDLQALLAPVAPLSKLLVGATWVGDRRWDLHFHSGEILFLPEGQEVAQKALMQFATIDQANNLLGRGIIHFDMRDSRRLIMRLPPASDVDVKDSTPSAMGLWATYND